MSFYDDASWLLIPEGIEEDIVFAQKPTNGLGDLTFTRASDATRTNSAGVIERTPWNLYTFSEMFSDVAWSKTNVTIGIDSTLAPNGTLTADKITASAVSANHFINRGFTLTGQHTVSVYAKAGEYQFLRMQELNVGKYNCVFNLSAGTATGSGATIQNVGNGWYRCIVVFDPAGAAISTGFIGIPTATTPINHTGDGTSGIFIWGAQIVEGTDAKPYFATTNRQDVPRLDYRNADGTLNSCPRLLLEPQRTNSIRNSTMVGAVAGSPGTLPTNWNQSGGGGLTTTISLGTENGLQYADIRYSGTATQSFLELRFEANNGISASNGQTWAFSPYIKAISGTIPTSQLVMIERNIASGFIAQGGVGFSATSTLQRFTFTRTLSGGATVAFVQPLILFTLTIGATYDFTIRIAAPQMELGATASTFIPTTTAAVTRLIDSGTLSNVYTNGLISAAGGTWFLDISGNLSVQRDSSTGLFIGDTTSINSGNQIMIRNASPTSAVRFTIIRYVSSVATNLFTTTTDNIKVAIKWNGSIVEVFVNGVKVSSGNSFTTTIMENMRYFPSSVVNINQCSLFPVPMTDAQCIQLTT
jgi:hypothetical protein